MPPPRWCGLAALLVALGAAMVDATDHMQLHSLHPPILANYWESGLRYWSFGQSSVVTDNGIRLTTAEKRSHGYLWNRHRNHLDSFQFNVTMYRGKPAAGSSRPEQGRPTGIAMWYTPDAPRHGDHHFFGAPSAFAGLGVAWDAQMTLSVFFSDGYKPVERPSDAKQHASCVASGATITVTVAYNAASKFVQVGYIRHNRGAEQQHREPQGAFGGGLHPRGRMNDLAMGTGIPRPCATLVDVPLEPKSFFGVTATNDDDYAAKSGIESFYVAPLDGSEDSEEEKHELHLFDHFLEIEAKKEATLRGDTLLKEGDEPHVGQPQRQRLRPHPPHRET